MSGLIGQKFDRYQILERLGVGGMATVYKAYDSRLDREVAIKVIRRDAFPPEQMDMLLKRFERESKSLARLSHANIVSVLDYGEFDGSPYLVMEYLSGGTLKDRLGKPMPWRDAVQMLLPIAHALEYVHDRNIINRDVKPSNILLNEKGQPMLTDFGLVKVFGEEAKEMTNLTGSGMEMGTPDYMAPEQWMGQTNAQSDLYSLGVVLYEMITGRRPYTADTPAGVLLKQANEPLPLPKKYVPDLPANVEAVLLKALAKEPQNRYPDMHTFAGDMQNLLSGRDVVALRTNAETLRLHMTGKFPKQTEDSAAAKPSVKSPAKPRSIVPVLAGVGVLGLVAVIGVALFVFNSGMLTSTPTADVATEIPQALPSSTDTQSPAPVTETSAPTQEFQTLLPPTAISLPTEIVDEKNVTMVYIPAGEFTLGSDTSGDVSSHPAQKIDLPAFYIDKFEVTNEMYDACVYAVECRKPRQMGSATRNTYFSNLQVYGNYPVIYVDWKMAAAYCAWRGARLPTEAEWEKAARGTDDRIYPWGTNDLDCSYANYQGCVGDTTPVNQYDKGQSIYGVFGMAGNVFEWTSSLDFPYPYDASDGREDPKKSGNRIARGGSWHDFGGNAGNVRVDSRTSLDPSYFGAYVGIRCVRPADQ